MVALRTLSSLSRVVSVVNVPMLGHHDSNQRFCNVVLSMNATISKTEPAPCCNKAMSGSGSGWEDFF